MPLWIVCQSTTASGGAFSFRHGPGRDDWRRVRTRYRSANAETFRSGGGVQAANSPSHHGPGVSGEARVALAIVGYQTVS